MTEETRKLLGGYATGTLTDEERTLLYQAALEDPELFAAMADEQAIRDLMDDSTARAELLSAVQDRRFSIAGALRDWLERPKSKVLVAVGAVLLVSIGLKQAMESRQPEQDRAAVAVLRPAERPAPAPATEKVESQPPASAPVQRRAEAKKPAVREIVPGAPPAVAPSPAPKPVAELATAADTAAAVEAPLLSWSVLLVDSSGAVTPVSRSYAFDEGDKARIRIEATQPGMLLARQGNEVLYAGTISPGLPVVLRRDITISGTGEPPAVDLEWAPAPPANPVTAAAPPPPPPPARAEARRNVPGQDGTAGGVVGGVIGGVPSGQPMGFRPPPVIETLSQQPVPSRNRVRVQLQRKSR